MTNAGAAVPRACPVVAGHRAWKRSTVSTRARQDVMRVRTISATIHRCSFFSERVFLAKPVFVTVKVVHILRDNDTLRVLPWATADAITSIHSRLITRSGGA